MQASYHMIIAAYKHLARFSIKADLMRFQWIKHLLSEIHCNQQQPKLEQDGVITVFAASGMPSECVCVYSIYGSHRPVEELCSMCHMSWQACKHPLFAMAQHKPHNVMPSLSDTRHVSLFHIWLMHDPFLCHFLYKWERLSWHVWMR